MNLRFTTASLRMSAGFLIWALHFAAIYVYVALVCARGDAQSQWLGVPVMRLLIGAMTLVAIAALALVLWKALRGDWHADARAAGQPFVAWIAAAVAAYGVVAVLWAALPTIWVAACPP